MGRATPRSCYRASRWSAAPARGTGGGRPARGAVAAQGGGLRAALVLATAVGCVQRAGQTVDAAPGSVIFAASLGPALELREVARALSPSPTPTVYVGDGERLFILVLPPGSFVGPDGRPPGEEALRAADLVAANAPFPPGSCGRCPLATAEPPKLVLPGERCPLPPFAEVHTGGARVTDPALLGRLGGALEVEWPGACDCPLDQGSTAAAPALELIDPRPDEAPEVWALSPEGTLGLFAVRGARVLDKGGARLAERERAGLPFAGPLLAAAGLTGERFAVLSHHPQAELEVSLEIFRRDLAVAATLRTLASRPERLSYLPEESRLLLLGAGRGRRASVESCRVDGDALSCASLLPPGLELLGETVLEAARLPDGRLLLLGSQGLLMLGGLPDPQASWVITPAGPDEASGTAGGVSFRLIRWALPGPGGETLREARPRFALAADAELVLCAFDGDAHLFTAPLSELSPGQGPPPSFRRVGGEAGAICLGLARRPAGGILAALGERAWELAPQAAPREAPALIPGTGRRISALGSPYPDLSLAFGPGSDPYLAELRAPAPEFRALEASALGGAPMRALYPAVGGALALAGDGSRRRVPPDGGVQTLPRLAGPPIEAAAGSGDQTLLVLSSSSGRRLALLDPTAEQPRPLGPAGAEPVVALAALGGGRWLIARTARLSLLTAEGERAVRIAWDDPDTTPVEAEPTCAEPGLRAAASAQGVGWAAGACGVLLRVEPLAEPPRARRVVLERDDLIIPGDPPELTAVAARCADDVLVAAPGQEVSEGERGRLWRVRSAPAGTLRPSAAPDLSPGPSRLSSGAPQALLGQGVVGFGRGPNSGGSLQQLGVLARESLADGVTHLLAEPSGAILVATDRGRLYRLLPPR